MDLKYLKALKEHAKGNNITVGLCYKDISEIVKIVEQNEGNRTQLIYELTSTTRFTPFQTSILYSSCNFLTNQDLYEIISELKKYMGVTADEVFDYAFSLIRKTVEEEK